MNADVVGDNHWVWEVCLGGSWEGFLDCPHWYETHCDERGERLDDWAGDWMIASGAGWLMGKAFKAELAILADGGVDLRLAMEGIFGIFFRLERIAGIFRFLHRVFFFLLRQRCLWECDLTALDIGAAPFHLLP